MEPITSFRISIERSRHFLIIYDLIRDTRRREVKFDWADKMKKLLKWPPGEKLIRVDGKGKNSMLLIKGKLGITREQFSHEKLSELLRSAWTSSVAAMDRYMHDTIVNHAWKLLGRAENEIPKPLKELQLPLIVTKRAIAKLKDDSKARPGTIVKAEIQGVLHKQTFQSSSEVLRVSKFLGIKDAWKEIQNKMPHNPPVEAIKSRLDEIVRRRNQIVHEADLILKTKGRTKLRDIFFPETREVVDWIDTFVKAFENIVKDNLY